MISKIQDYSDIFPGAQYTNGVDVRTIEFMARMPLLLAGDDDVEYSRPKQDGVATCTAKSFKRWVNTKPDVEENDFVYAAMINLSGLWSTDPTGCQHDQESGSWWDKSGNLEIKKLGVCHDGAFISFASANEDEVVAWISGAKAAAQITANWCQSFERLQ